MQKRTECHPRSACNRLGARGAVRCRLPPLRAQRCNRVGGSRGEVAFLGGSRGEVALGGSSGEVTRGGHVEITWKVTWEEPPHQSTVRERN